ncbi:hypothetical protein Dsin_032407 [Dipteronia sinensis]|uniref:Uncharacterized protein n=1 Tax=Dipteronia sinensis TaxID=43782 RepID=A0AAD9ZMX5_9ROSI|nr:hypothetical protein Dsin_032407 [Dipteronia sinensis]
MIIHKEKVWATIDVEFVYKYEFRLPANPIQSACTVSPVKPIENPGSPTSTPNYKSVSGSNNPFASHASPDFTLAANDQATPVSTTKHAVVDDNDSFESSDTEDESGDDDGGQGATKDGTEEQGGFTAECTQRCCGWVLRAWKSNKGTYWHLKSFVNEHTCDSNDNYNIEFKRVSACVIGDLFASKFGDPGLIICPKDIVSEMMEQHGIHLSYNKAYRSKKHALNKVFGDLWESFHKLPAYFYVLEQSNHGTVKKIKIDSKNRFKYGFMAIGASIEGFNSVIRPVIYIDATHLKARTRGVLVAMCKDGNEMILGMTPVPVQNRWFRFRGS